ncbi:FMN-binding protein MioC [Paraglaciecola sp. 2405UD69-4]|uniref:FMN-binding protein MioC n=1 Tax=Paraglaciecola sp. 2405UD69-4 TaxID=3391836 RepID=UPI0039C93B9B
MAKFEIIVGSVLGATEYVADAVQEVLSDRQHSSNIHLTPELANLDEEATWIICSSTHGAGDLPDNIQPFANELTAKHFPKTKFIIIGLGDSSYDTFCYGAIQLETSMKNAGATLLLPAIHIDVLNHPIPENAAVDYLNTYFNNPDLNG